jgi:hypothetical protein
MKKYGLVFLFVCLAFVVSAQTNFPFASRANRDATSFSLRTKVDSSLAVPLTEKTASLWMGTFWAMELMLYKPKGYEQLIPQQLIQISTMGPGIQRSFFEMLYTLFQGQFIKEVQAILPAIRSEKVKAMALEYLTQSGLKIDPPALASFSTSVYYPVFLSHQQKYKLSKPAIADFTRADFLPGETVLCSFQSINRNQPGYLMIRDANGNWLKDATGQVLQFPQLARAISNLPYYLTNGNTPQGLYRILGYDTSANDWIGPTTNLQLVLPFENQNLFFNSSSADSASYRLILGSYLQQFQGLWESYTAGRLGRTEIIAHGTTIDPLFYQTQAYYPNTPSLGCLCSPELWNEKGERTYSAQAEWIRLVKSLLQQPRYLIVAEVSDFLPINE